MIEASGHASSDEVALYLIDALAQPARQRFEVHVEACPSCGEALAREAAAEQTLIALWPSVRRPLAEVVQLPRPERPPAPAQVRSQVHSKVSSSSGLGLQGSFGGLAAAVVAVLFAGWWMDAGQMVHRMVEPPARGQLASGASCYHPRSELASRGTVEDRICIPTRSAPSLAGLASWGMCMAAPASSEGLCVLDPDSPLGLMCTLSESQ